MKVLKKMTKNKANVLCKLKKLQFYPQHPPLNGSDTTTGAE
jgi:hypothetical protein